MTEENIKRYILEDIRRMKDEGDFYDSHNAPKTPNSATISELTVFG
ncbi:MAG: hypothetical protein MO846_03040 [Candidatus Devosia symbiotica]|nr:hypothetical protein [Candidatus Devosia symbiotica]